jgi:hypothetical protein
MIESDRRADIVGVGINYNIDHLFKTGVSIKQISELPAVLTGLLRTFVLGKSHRG